MRGPTHSSWPKSLSPACLVCKWLDQLAGVLLITASGANER